MELLQIKNYLEEQAKTHGAIKTLCQQHDLNYLHVWRFAKGRVKRLNHEDAVKLTAVIKGPSNA